MIELINDIPELEREYRRSIQKAINRGLITEEEWNNRFKFYRDDFGYSIIHFFECIYFNVELFVTNNLLMIRDREYLEKRFNVTIRTVEEILNAGKNK